MEDVRPVLVNEHTGRVGMIVGIAGDVRPPIDDEHPLAGIARQPFREHTARVAGADDQIIIHKRSGAAVPLAAGRTVAERRLSGRETSHRRGCFERPDGAAASPGPDVGRSGRRARGCAFIGRFYCARHTA